MHSAYPPAILSETAVRARAISSDWRKEVPQSINVVALGIDGNPAWNPDFERWLTNTGRTDNEDRLATTRAMRRLRRIAPRMFEVCYRLLVLGEPIADCTRWLNERAKRNAIPLPDGKSAHYTEKDTIAILIGSTDFVWGLLEPVG